MVGQSVPEEMPTRLEEEALDRKYPTGTGSDQSYDANRHRRLSAFEDHLRRNRVDITRAAAAARYRRTKWLRLALRKQIQNHDGREASRPSLLYGLGTFRKRSLRLDHRSLWKAQLALGECAVQQVLDGGLFDIAGHR